MFIYQMVKSYQSIRDIKRLEEYYDFSMQVFEWIKEIKDPNKRSDLLLYHITYISSDSVEDSVIKSKKIDEFKSHIERNWGYDISSLKLEIRERKIDSILI